MIELLSPGMLLVIGGILLPLITKQLRPIWLVALPVLGPVRGQHLRA